ncbi:hypothetical protein SALBM135S_03045 [Streptomyces alboniger]
MPTIGKSLSLLNFEMSSTFSQTCLGTIGTSRAAIVACGFFSSMTSSVGLGAVTFLKLVTKLEFAVAVPSLDITLLNVHAASSAVAGLPSDHFESDRMVYVHVSLSAEGFQSVAKPSIARLFFGS